MIQFFAETPPRVPEAPPPAGSGGARWILLDARALAGHLRLAAHQWAAIEASLPSPPPLIAGPPTPAPHRVAQDELLLLARLAVTAGRPIP